ncbi:hypothetical protein [Stenomitos frigidus]|uniref:Uncharacterized protein n=1 Tax=Stenomitos frigidus ULC18 TaxID=2107698 RepID=A0A2T1EKB2_9CYAN|nr:hypothetical protein [Stenomitos frigidus]PSB33108.1 hypothetical protein C7B82_04765 [Stenomitos frigidus ULC18]
MNEEFEKKLIKDLEKTGFVSEMQAVKIFHSLGWDAKLGKGYFDRDENITREIDLSAYYPVNLKYKDSVCVCSFFNIIAEIKKAEQPWIVFRSHLHPMAQFCAWNNITTSINLPEHPTKLTAFMSKSSLLISQRWEGTGVHHAFKDPSAPSQWYKAFTSVCKAAEDECEANTTEGEKISRDILAEPTEFSFFQPVVILDGTLIAAELSNSGKIVLEEVTSAPFTFEFKTRNYSRSSYRVDLVTMDGLEAYLHLSQQRHTDILEGFRKYIPYPLEEEA